MGLQEARRLAENRPLVRDEIDDAVADDDIGAYVPAGRLVDVSLVIGDVDETGRCTQSLGLVKLRVGHIDADDAAVRFHLEPGNEGVHA
jgi:hypothetical protein